MDLMASDMLGSASHREEATTEQYWKPQDSSGDSKKRAREGEIKGRISALRRWEVESRGESSMRSWLSLSSPSDDGETLESQNLHGTKKKRQRCDDGWLSLSRDSSSVSHGGRKEDNASSKGSTSDVVGSSKNPFKKMRKVARGPVGDSRRCLMEAEDAGHKEVPEAESSTAANVESATSQTSER